jgi:hypothetical protein
MRAIDTCQTAANRISTIGESGRVRDQDEAD